MSEHEEELGIGDYGRAGLSMLKSSLAEPAAGWAGILTGGSLEAMESARQRMTFTPEDDPKASRALEKIGYAMEPIALAAEELNKKMGDYVYENTGSPLLAGLATALPTAIASASGLRGLKPRPSAWNPDVTPTPAMMESAMIKTLDPFNLHKGKNPLKAEMYVGPNAVGIPESSMKTIIPKGEKGTGWRLAPDGKLRFQTSDKAADWHQSPQISIHPDKPTMLGDILKHDELFKMYPELKNVDVLKTSEKGVGGSFLAKWDNNKKFSGAEIKLNTFNRTDNEVMSTLLHEVQHWVQTRESFSPGSSTAKFDNLLAMRNPMQAVLSGEMQAMAMWSKAKHNNISVEDMARQNPHTISTTAYDRMRKLESGAMTEEDLMMTIMGLQDELKTLNAIRKKGSGWSYKTTLGEIEARDVSQMWERENLMGLDPQDMVPSINRKKVGIEDRPYKDKLIDPETESLILPAATASRDTKLGQYKNVD